MEQESLVRNRAILCHKEIYMKFRKKPVEIEAVQFVNTREGRQELFDFVVGPHITWQKHANRMIVETLNGWVQLYPGEWLVRGIAGEYYPCADEIFAETYEPVITQL